MFKVIFILNERDDLDRTTALNYWRKQHAEIVSEIPGLRRYVVNLAVADPMGDSPQVLGTAELVFDDEDSFKEAFEGPEFKAGFADVPNFADPHNVTAFVSEDVPVIT